MNNSTAAMRNAKLLIKVFVIVVGGVSLVVLYALDRHGHLEGVLGTTPLKILVKFKPAFATVTNADSVPIQLRSCQINDNFEFRLERPPLQPGETWYLPLRAFIRDDGVRFEPRMQAIVNLFISCRSQGGRQFWGEFRPVAR